LQPRVLRLGVDEDRDAGLGVLPESEEVLIGRPAFDGITLQDVGASETEIRGMDGEDS
jgi:hypothetical protein